MNLPKFRYRTRPLTGLNRKNPEGYKPSHRWHPIYRKRGESQDDLWKRMNPDLLDVTRFPAHIDGVNVIAAVEGFLVTLDPKSAWPVLHPYPSTKPIK